MLSPGRVEVFCRPRTAQRATKLVINIGTGSLRMKPAAGREEIFLRARTGTLEKILASSLAFPNNPSTFADA